MAWRRASARSGSRSSAPSGRQAATPCAGSRTAESSCRIDRTPSQRVPVDLTWRPQPCEVAACQPAPDIVPDDQQRRRTWRSDGCGNHTGVHTVAVKPGRCSSSVPTASCEATWRKDLHSLRWRRLPIVNVRAARSAQLCLMFCKTLHEGL